jgi:hypothetical protein
VQEVKSKAMTHVGFKDGTLSVQMHNGKVFHYEGVPASVHAEMMASPSVGAYYARQIKGQFKLKAPEKSA